MKRGQDVKCPVCSKVVYRFPSELKRGYTFCSKCCWYTNLSIEQKKNPDRYKRMNKARAGVDYSSEQRRKTLSNSIKKAYIEGRLVTRKGSRNNLWKGGIASEQNRVRQTAVYREWRKQVYERDDFTCQVCFVKGGQLHAHHIKTFSKHPELRYDVSNGMTVCVGCHSKIHGRKIPNIGLVNKK